MPLSGGTSGAHDDSMHQGNAKRDVAEGLAALDAGGHVLAPGYRFIAARGAAEQITIRERTSDERAFRLIRVGANDYEARVNVAGTEQKVQEASMRDVANGLAVLDAAGSLMVPGSKIYYTRNGSDDVHIYERTSDEEAYAFHRVGANDYTFFVKESNVWKRMQTESMKGVANGIAGLDANVLLDPIVHAVGLEEYSNHLGAVDNFTQADTAGNATANTDAANHEMDLSTGVAVVGYARFEGKTTMILSTVPIVVSCILRNMVNGVGNYRAGNFGLADDFSNGSPLQLAGFRWYNDGTWRTAVNNGAMASEIGMAAVNDGDILSVVAMSSFVKFYVNGILIRTATNNIPIAAMHFGAAVNAYVGAATTAREISVDMMSLKRYV